MMADLKSGSKQGQMLGQTLGLMLITHNEGRRLAAGLHQLALAAGQGARVLVIDRGSQDDTLARLKAFGEKLDGVNGVGVDILRLEGGPEGAQMDMLAGLRLARTRLETPYVLGLTGQDMICPGAIAPLAAQLEREQPDLMICNHGWWVAGPGSVLPCADAGRMAVLAEIGAGVETEAPDPAALRALLADPRRLLSGPSTESGTEPDIMADPGPGPARAWDVYDRALDAAAQAGRVSVFSDPVLLRPVPADRVAEVFGLVAAQLQACTDKDRAALLVRLLPRLDDEMTLLDPGNARAILASAELVRAALPWRVRRRVATLGDGPAAQLLGALQRGDASAAMAVLSGLAAVQDRARLLALSGEIQALREDIDLALPGPEYLLELYERVRPV